MERLHHSGGADRSRTPAPSPPCPSLEKHQLQDNEASTMNSVIEETAKAAGSTPDASQSNGRLTTPRDWIRVVFSANTKIDPDNPNPTYIAVGREAYRLQSRWLHIPDRCGFFSSGPARAHEFQGRVLADALPSWLLFMSLMALLAIILLATVEPATSGHDPFVLGCGFLAIVSLPCWVQHCALAQRELRRTCGGS